MADVSKDGAGLIGIYLAQPSSPKNWLSYQEHSYVTVSINGKYYTNNTNIALLPTTGAVPANPTGYLQNAKISKIQDTVRTIWQPQGPNNIDIVQDVYPVFFPFSNSGQIVYRFYAVDHANGSFNVQLQFLLDVEMSGTGSGNNDTTNDNAPITTRAGYTQDWQDYSPIPPYFIATLHPLSSSLFPGNNNILSNIGIGFNNDSLAPGPMGLMQPTKLEFVDWPTIVTGYTWGAPFPFFNHSTDEAMLIQWPQTSVSSGPDSVVELGRGSYGTPACGNPICFGNLDALVIHPDHMVWNPLSKFYSDGKSTFDLDHFPVDVIVWNPNANSEATNASATESITNSNTGVANGPVQIVSPLPASNGGYSQTHKLSGSAVQPYGASYATWIDTVVQDLPNGLINCSTDSTYDIAVSVSANGVGQPIFINPPCACPVVVDCLQKDLIAPRFSDTIVVARTNCGYAKEYKIDSIYDNLSTDQGIRSITDSISPSPGAITVNGIPIPIAGCPPVVGPIFLIQKDTLHTPCVTLTATDCAGNVSTKTVCFEKCLPPVPFDTLPPKFHLTQRLNWNVPTDTSCGNKCSHWVVTDTVKSTLPALQNDKGLSSISVLGGSATNMTFTLFHPVTPGMGVDSFSVCVDDSMQDGTIIVQATDAASPPNTSWDTIQYCTVADVVSPRISDVSVTGGWNVHVTDSQAWDRGVDTVYMTFVQNCIPVVNPAVLGTTKIDSADWKVFPLQGCPGPASLDYSVQILDTFARACFTAQATDCAGNKSVLLNSCTTQRVDSFRPCDTILASGPGWVTFEVSDYHDGNGNPLFTNFPSDTITYDEGIDSIWFFSNTNVELKHGGVSSPSPWNSQPQNAGIHGTLTGHDHPLYQKLDTFTLMVIDSLVPDSAACLYFNAIDGADNSLCNAPEEWCYPLTHDLNAPKISVTTAPCPALTIAVTDSQPRDRGVYEVRLDSIVNFVPLDDTAHPGAPSVTETLAVLHDTASALATVTTLDLYGHLFSSSRAAHTTSTDVWIYKQDLGMNATGIAESKQFKVPIFLKTTDAIPVAQKHLSQFQFTFHLTGSPALTFAGTQTANTLSAGWTVTPAPGTVPPPNPRTYTITGSGTPLMDPPANDTLIYLLFNTASVTDVEEAHILIDPDPCGEDVIYNGGNDTAIVGPNFNVILPAPSGRMNGGTVVLKDSCATIVGNPAKPTILWLAPAKPNPSASAATVKYAVPLQAPVVLELYNALGQKVRTLVNEVQDQGNYEVAMETSDLPEGTYFLRLASGGTVCTQRVMLQH